MPAWNLPGTRRRCSLLSRGKDPGLHLLATWHGMTPFLKCSHRRPTFHWGLKRRLTCFFVGGGDKLGFGAHTLHITSTQEGTYTVHATCTQCWHDLPAPAHAWPHGIPWWGVAHTTFGPLCAQCMHLLAIAGARNYVAEELLPTTATCRQLGCRGKECRHITLALSGIWSHVVGGGRR